MSGTPKLVVDLRQLSASGQKVGFGAVKVSGVVILRNVTTGLFDRRPLVKKSVFWRGGAALLLTRFLRTCWQVGHNG